MAYQDAQSHRNTLNCSRVHVLCLRHEYAEKKIIITLNNIFTRERWRFLIMYSIYIRIKKRRVKRGKAKNIYLSKNVKKVKTTKYAEVVDFAKSR